MSVTGTSKIKVAFLIQGLQIGGLERVVADLAIQLDRNKFIPLVICYDSVGEFENILLENGIQVLYLPRRPGVDYAYVIKLAKLLKAERVQILNAHNETALFYGTLAARLARVSKVIYTEHDGSYPKSSGHNLLNKMLLRWNHHVITVAEYLKQHLVQSQKINAGKISTIHNGICWDTDGVRSKPSQALDLPLRGAFPILGIVARLDPIKNHLLLFQAVRGLVSKLPKLRLLVVGDGPEHTTLSRHISAHQLQEHIFMVGEQQNVKDWYTLFDIFVLPSKSEGLSVTLIEALAAGVPVIATDVGGNGEIIKHEVNGLLIPSAKPQALQQAIVRLANDPGLQQRLSQSGKERFRTAFSVRNMVAGYEQVFSK